MSHREGLFEWTEQVSTQFPNLSNPEAVVLALWSFGIAVTRSSGITTVAVFLGLLLGQKDSNLRQRLREWCYDASDKRGEQRQEVTITHCFEPLLRWLLQWWADDERRLALALDATTLRQTFTVLAVSVVYRGVAIPVAWAIVPATAPGSWQPHWQGLLALLKPAIPRDWYVLVLADRGLYANWLFTSIVACGWHPFLRINQQGQFRPIASPRFRSLSQAVRQGGLLRRWDAICFKTRDRQLRCTQLGQWSLQHADPWLVVTDLPPRQAQVSWYGLRSWIEAGFKFTKRGGWHWEQTKMTDPARAERLWLAMAVATLWVVSWGDPEALSDLTTGLPRLAAVALSPFRLGWIALLVRCLKAAPLPCGRFRPSVWPYTSPVPALY